MSTTFTAVTARRNQGALAVFNAAPLQTPTTVQEIDYRYSTSPAITARYVDPISKGNTLFVTFNSRANAGTITPPAGWTEVASSESASEHIFIQKWQEKTNRQISDLILCTA